MDIFIYCGLFVIGMTFFPLFLSLWSSKTKKFMDQRLNQIIALQQTKQTPPVDLTKIERFMDNLPNKVSQSIQGSVNRHKGILGELIGYIHLQAQYDRIIPLNSITDFVGIRFPKNGDLGTIDFIDIKTGKSAKLSSDQTALRKLIQNKQIGFIKFEVNIDET